MSNELFIQLWQDALQSSDSYNYISEHQDSSFFSFFKTDFHCSALSSAEYLKVIWDVAHMSIRDICRAAELSQAGFARQFGIPLRTVEAWCQGLRKPTDYDRLLFAESLGLISRSPYRHGNKTNLFVHSFGDQTSNENWNRIMDALGNPALIPLEEYALNKLINQDQRMIDGIESIILRAMYDQKMNLEAYYMHQVFPQILNTQRTSNDCTP